MSPERGEEDFEMMAGWGKGELRLALSPLSFCPKRNLERNQLPKNKIHLPKTQSSLSHVIFIHSLISDILLSMTKRLLPIYIPLLFISTLITLFPKDALAYIDPGSGSYITQVILGFVFGGLFMVKLYWKKVKNAIFKNRSKIQKEKNKKV